VSKQLPSVANADDVFALPNGTAEAVPLQSNEFLPACKTSSM